MERTVWYVDVQPRQTVSWRVSREAELRIGDAPVWLTRHRDPYDYWLQPGDIVRLVRGERVWISSDSEHAIEVSLTSYRAPARGLLTRYWPRSLTPV
jgi:hypothetical protein